MENKSGTVGPRAWGQGKAKGQGRIDRLQLSVVLVMDAISHL